IAPEEEAEAVATLQKINHPGLLPIQRAIKEPGRLLLVSDLIPGTLWGWWQRQPRDASLANKREQLMLVLRQVAKTLDDVARQHRVYDWTLNPQNILMDGERVVLAEAGLAQLFWVHGHDSLGALNPRCGAPELFDAAAELDGRADVFSLGVIYLWLM